MLGWMNRDALERTLETGLATFFSRSRGKLWVKGESSGNVLRVHSVTADCDADTLLLLVEPAGPSLSYRSPELFFQAGGSRRQPHGSSVRGRAVHLRARTNDPRSPSQHRRQELYEEPFRRGASPKINAKISEEAGELVAALAAESEQRVLSEASDLLFHVLVGLRARGLDFQQVLARSRRARSRVGTKKN